MMRFGFVLLTPLVLLISSAYLEAFEVAGVTLVVTHRVYKDFREEHTVPIGERFYLSDSEFSAEAAEFLPDFAINVEKKEIFSRSDEPNNPAVRVVIYQNDEKVDEVWAFREGMGAPHFSRNSFLAFQILEYKAVSAPGSAEEPDAPDEVNERDGPETDGAGSGEEGGDSEE